MFYFSQWGFIFIMWQPDKVSINVWMDVSHVGLRGVFEYAARYLRRGMLTYMFLRRRILHTSDDRVH